MISISETNGLKTYIEVYSNIENKRPLYIINEGNKIIWKNASDVFDIDALNVGSIIRSDSIANKAAFQKKVLTEKIPRTVYGIRLLVTSIPIINEAGDAVGAFSTFKPILHPVAVVFDDLAPVLAEMFPAGVFLFMTDLEQFVHRQPSKNFDILQVRIGSMLDDYDFITQAIKNKKTFFVELDSSRYGIPVQVVTYPLFDEDDANEVVATFGMVVPKKIAVELRNMSHNLDNGLSGITSAVEQLTASATQIHSNGQNLNNEIKGIISFIDQINTISIFIKKIADETKMLGLNASIESARAGNVGRGFGVVAEKIRDLSEQSKSTVPQIKGLTDKIKFGLDSVAEKSNSSLNASQEQVAASEEITASIEEINAMSGELATMAKQL